MNFDAPLAAGTVFGQSSGAAAGDIAFSSNGIAITVEEFEQSTGNLFLGDANIDTFAVPGGSGQSLRFNNVSLRFDFSGLSFFPAQVNFLYSDFGGSENVSVNDDTIQTGDLAAMTGSTSGGTSVTVIQSGSTISSRSGNVVVSGSTNSLKIGGQELWIDDVCAFSKDAL